MELKIKNLHLTSGGSLISILNEEDAKKLDLNPSDRIKLKRNKKSITTAIDIASKKSEIKPGHIGLFQEVIDKLNGKEREIVKIEIESTPKSIEYIKKKLEGGSLTKYEMNEIIKDIISNRLTETEMTYFVSGCYINGLTIYESAYLTEAIVESGKQLKISNYPRLDKHCISGDIPTMVKNNNNTKIKPISEIIDPIFERCKPNQIYKEEDAEYTKHNLRNLKVLTYDKNYKVSYKPVSAVVRVKSPPFLYNIKLLGNREIKASSDHTIFILKKGKIINIPSNKIKENDYVVVPSNLQQKKELKEITIKSNQGIRNYRKFNNKIKITKELVRLIAYYIAEGFRNFQGVFLNFGAHEKELIEDCIKCTEKIFNFTPTINNPHKTATRVCLYSKTLSKIFKNDLRCGDNVLSKKIPSFIFDINKELKIEFLRALFKCDGYIRRGYEAEYTTSSYELHNQLKYMLSTLNMSVSTHETKECIRNFKTNKSKIQKSYQIYTQARELYGERKNNNVSFINLIPIKELGEIDTKSMDWETRRLFKRQNYITKDKLRKLTKYIKSNDIKKILSGDLSVLRVKENKKIKTQTKYIYDFQVKGYNKFIAGTAPICIHNCVGGVPGNRTTMIIVPILTAAGFTIAKTSTRSITSPSGTADTMEVLAPVSHSLEKIKKIIKKTKGCIIWGGTLDLAAADDKLIKLERPLSLDPEGILLASILAKKLAVNSTHILIDIPYGKGAKIETKKEAKRLKRKFTHLGKLLGMQTKAIITDGSQPIGNGIGPALEAKDVLSVLSNKGPEDLKKKSLLMSAKLLKMAGVKNSTKVAKKILESGKAYKKMQEIIKAQGGKKIDPEKIKIGKYK